MINISFNEVARAAREILSKGENLNSESVGNFLGVKDSVAKKKIQELLNEWKQQKNSEKFTYTGITSKDLDVQLEKENLLNRSIIEKTKDLQRSLSLVRATLESTTDGILVVSNEGRMIDFNQKFIELARMSPEILASGDEKLALQHVLDQVIDPQELLNQLLTLPPEAKGELNETLFKDGRIIERYSQPQVINNQVVGRVWSFRDVTSRRKAEQALLLRNRAIEASYHGIIILSLAEKHYPIVYANPAFERITGYSFTDIENQNLKFLFRKERQQSAIQSLKEAFKHKHDVDLVLKCFRKDETMFWCEMHFAPVKNNDGKVTDYVVILNDITDRKNMEEQLLQQATHDSLTGLPNRALLNDRIEQAILYSARRDDKFAMLFIDLDRFKIVNDGLGHNIGDALLIEVGQRLQHCTRVIDTVARVGGDEFIGVFPSLRSEDEIIPMLERIKLSIMQPYYVDGHEITVTASMGVSFYPKDGEDTATLMRNADISMYYSKENGRNAFTLYQEEMNHKVSERLHLEHDLRQAIEKNQLLLHYQPLFDLKTGQVIGTEALLRWMHPERGMIPPLQFIPLAEETGLIIPISEWVISEACRQNQLWQKMGLPPIYVAINMTAKQFKQPDIANKIHDIIKSSNLDPRFVELELTESILIEQAEETMKILYKFKELGVKMAIDDFGTGYSSLSYLKQFPVDKLKIDRSFIKELPMKHNDMAITKAIINLGHTLNLQVLAEGIETEEQLNFIRENGCDQAQGFLFSKPVDAVNCYKFIKEKNCLTD